MANMLFANNCNTTLASSLTAGASSMSVTSATGFPVPTGVQYFYCTLADAATQTTIEIVKVTAVSGTTFTITRGQDGTSATAFAAGAVVSLRLVRASLNDFPKLDETNTFNADQSISGALTVSAGLVSTSSFTATPPSDGLVMDYNSGFGRFSTFASDGFKWFNGGVANTILMTLSSSGTLAPIGNVDATTITVNGFGVRVRQPATGSAILQFTNNVANTQLASISHDGSNLSIASNVGNTIVGTLQFADGSTQVSHAVPQVTTYTSSSGTYTVPTNTKYLIVKMIGGGGAGGGSTGTTAGGGGGAGGYLEGLISSPSSTYSYAVGGASGTTTFGSSLFSAGGGSAGTSSSAAAIGGAGGSSSGGYLNLTGATGGFGWASSPYFNGGMGAASQFGAGGSGGGTGYGNGFSAVTYGSGGGGAVGGGGAGNGSGGLIIITAYF
jgi:hypothetical protein